MNDDARSGSMFNMWIIVFAIINMFPALLRHTLKFCTTTIERPFTPSLWNAMSISQLQRLPQEAQLQGVLHAVGLMQGQITPFDYDFFQWSCGRVAEQQQRLSKEDIGMMLRLAARHRIVIEPFQKHIENELFLRIHRDYESDLQGYDESIKKEIEALLGQLQKGSQDYFSLLNHQQQAQKEEIEGKQQEQSEDLPQTTPKNKSLNDQTQKFIIEMNEKLTKNNKGKEFSICDIVQVMGLLKAMGSKNLPLMQYLLELLTVQYESGRKATVSDMLQYVSGLAYLCQSLMAEYSANKQRYTARSVKRIYKFQTMYYHEHLRQLQEVRKELKIQQIEQLIDSYCAFPVKRREIRRRIGGILGEEVKDKGLPLIQKFLAINGKDEKMKKSYCQIMGIDLEKAKELGLYQQKAPKLPQPATKTQQQQQQKKTENPQEAQAEIKQ